MELPTTLTIANVSDFFLAIFRAFIVSAVSPDCVMNITNVCLSNVFWKYSNSEASITSVGIPIWDSIRYSPISEA